MAKPTNTKPTPPPPPARTAPSQAAAAPSRSERAPSHAEISARAYEIFLARGGEHGRHEDDWKQAERELQLGKQ